MAKKKNNRKGEIKMTNEEIKNEGQVVTEEVKPTVLNEGEENITIENADVNGEEVKPVDPEVKPEEIEEGEPDKNPEEHTGETEQDSEDQKPVDPEVKPAEDEPAEGVVEGCARLNVRKEASKTADVVRVINKGDSVMVDLVNSTDDFYKVFTLDFDGYCVKDFIKIK